MESRAPGLMPSYHSHQEVEINLISVGSMTYLFGGVQATLPPGRLCIFWATIPHRVISIEPQTRFYCVNISLSCILRWQLPNDFTYRLLRGELVREFGPSMEEHDKLLFAQWSKDMKSGASELRKVVELEVEARVRRLALTQAPDDSYSGGGDSPTTAFNQDVANKVELMARFIGDRYQDPISAADIGDAVSLHPKYASALFKKHLGMTMGAYLRAQRLSQAKRLLATTEFKVVDIAYEAGFNSVSRFYEVFQQEFGQTPNAYRVSLIGG